MLKRMLEERNKEEGFTLIELLVVIIIIGILAAIAIPVFLNQRSGAWDAAVESDLRNAATAQETILTDGGTYADGNAAVKSLQSVGFKYSDGANYVNDTALILVAATQGLEYCMVATSQSGQSYYYSSPGGLSETVPTMGSGTVCPTPPTRTS